MSPLAGAAFGALLGLIVGSFLATVAIRWPAGRSAVRGRSACDGCGAVLGARELVPILSWAAQRGRCRRCGARIDPSHPAVEAAAAVVGACAFAAAPPLAGLAGAAFGWTLLLLAVLDVEHHWLPDRLTLPLLAGGLLLGLAPLPPAATDRAIGATAGFGTLWAIAAGYRLLRDRDGMGGGDPKLFGAVGAWLGWAALPFVLLGASLVGLVAVALSAARGGNVTATTRLPLGALIAVAAYPAWLVMIGRAA